jgi:hypothetical protein
MVAIFFTNFSIAGVVFDRLDGRSIEYTVRMRQPSSGSWDTGSRGITTQLGPRISKLVPCKCSIIYLRVICKHNGNIMCMFIHVHGIGLK